MIDYINNFNSFYKFPELRAAVRNAYNGKSFNVDALFQNKSFAPKEAKGVLEKIKTVAVRIFLAFASFIPSFQKNLSEAKSMVIQEIQSYKHRMDLSVIDRATKKRKKKTHSPSYQLRTSLSVMDQAIEECKKETYYSSPIIPFIAAPQRFYPKSFTQKDITLYEADKELFRLGLLAGQ